jgi:hypothetical protein
MAAMSSGMKQKSRTKSQAKDTDLKVLEVTPPWEWPADAGEKFRAILTDHSAPESDRLIAAGLAGDYVAINDELAVTLMEILGSASESPKLRSSAAISLGPALEAADMGEFDDPYDPPPISEEIFDEIRRLLHLLYQQESIPGEVRRSILEASVRAQEDWHADAIKKAYASGDRDSMLTAVFGMRWVDGFEKEILESLKSPDAEIHAEAVQAAGAQEVDDAWEHVYELVKNERTTPKPLLLAAISAVANIRQDTPSLEILNHLVESDDKDVSEAADEALSLAGAYSEFEEEELEDGDASGWIN